MMSNAADRPDPSRSANSISVRAYHVLNIDGYSRTLDTQDDMQYFQSCPFHAGGRTWHILYYPMGAAGPGNMDFIAFFLVLADTVDEAVTAKATFSLLDQDQKPVPSYSRTTTEVDFSEHGSIGYYKFIKKEDLERSSEVLKDDCFSVRVDVHIVKGAAPSTMVSPYDIQHKHLGVLLSRREGTDVEFRVRGETFVAHRLVLKARSPVFKVQLLSLMKDATTKNVVIEINDIEPQVFKAMLTFIYTDTLPRIDHDDEFAMAQRLLVAAERYSLQRLKLICEDRLCNYIDTSSASTILALAEKHHCPGLKEACFNFLGSSTVLFAVIETEEFEYLARSYPAITKELIYNVLNHDQDKANIARWNQEVEVSVIKI